MRVVKHSKSDSIQQSLTREHLYWFPQEGFQEQVTRIYNLYSLKTSFMSMMQLSYMHVLQKYLVEFISMVKNIPSVRKTL